MTSPATQEPCPKCGSRMTAEAVGEFRNWSECRECGHRWDYRKPPSQRAELLTQEHLRLALNTVNQPYRDALKEHIAALTQRVEAADKLASVAIHNHSLFYCGKGKCGICNALEAYRALSQEPRNG